MTAELTSAIPVEGGYVVWVERAFGKNWGFLCGWWTWIYAWIDVAIYPGLFAVNVGNLMRMLGFENAIQQTPWLQWAVGLAVIVPFTVIKLFGIKSVGRANVLFSILLILPFAIFIAAGLSKVIANPARTFLPLLAPEQDSWRTATTTGLFTVMWNYLGWDSISTVAEEVEAPERNMPKGIFIALALIVASYLLPSIVGLAFWPNPAEWKEGVWSQIADRVGGRGLGLLVAAGGCVASMGLFSSTLLSSSRIPFVLSRSGRMPARLCTLHSKWGTPWIAILVSAVFYTIFSYQSFEKLRTADVIVYSVGLVLELGSLITLRVREPNLARPYKIPWGWVGIFLVVIPPSACVVFAVASQIREEGVQSLWLALGCLATGPLWMLGERLVRQKA